MLHSKQHRSSLNPVRETFGRYLRGASVHPRPQDIGFRRAGRMERTLSSNSDTFLKQWLYYVVLPSVFATA